MISAPLEKADRSLKEAKYEYAQITQYNGLSSQFPSSASFSFSQRAFFYAGDVAARYAAFFGGLALG